MNAFAILALVIAPILAVGLVAMTLHGHEADRLARRRKAEEQP